jgi:hypothetical protein
MPDTDRSPAAHVQTARDEIAAQIRAYRDLVGAASKASGMSLTRIDAALAAFEPAFFNNLLIALDARFAAGARDRGGPHAELRLLADSLLAHGGVLTANTEVPYDADTAVLKIDIGERIALNADDFEALCAAVLAALETPSAGA